MAAYIKLWKLCLDFKGKTSRRDFWVSGILFNFFGMVIHVTEALILMLRYGVSSEQAVQGTVFLIYSCIGLMALISMSVRRLRDGGYWNRSAWKFLIPIIGFLRLIWCLFIENSASEDKRN